MMIKQLMFILQENGSGNAKKGSNKSAGGVTLKGQKHQAKVINVGTGTKNECPQQ